MKIYERRFASRLMAATAGSPVSPVIALKWKKITGDFPDLEGPHFVFGQLDTGDYNMQSWIKGVKFIWLGDKEMVLTENLTSLQVSLSGPGQTKNLKAAAAGYNCIRLTWSRVFGAEGYNIYRSTNGGKSYQLHDCTEGAARTAYTDKGLKTGTRYMYRIKAYRIAAGKDLEGAFSSPAGASPVLGQASVKKLSKAGGNGIRAVWSKVSGASGYQVKIGTNSAVTRAAKTFKTGSSTTAKTITKLKKGTKYYVKVRACRNSKRQDGLRTLFTG